MAAFDQMCILGNKSLSRSNLPSGSLPAEKASPEIASGANKICWQKLHSRPGIALFLHNRPTDAIFGSTLAQLLERKVLFARPRYGFFGGQFIPLATFPYGTSITCKKEGKIYVEGRILRSVTMSRDK
jgi:hypothetical protein